MWKFRKESTKYLFHGNISSIFNGKKKTKTEGKFENRKNLKKRKYLISLRIKLKIFRNGRCGNYLENIYNKKKGYLLSLRVEPKNLHNGRGG